MRKLLKYILLPLFCLILWQCVPKVEPEEPDDPTEQQDPTDPEEPADPEEPTEPEEPSEPEGPKSQECVFSTLRLFASANPTLKGTVTAVAQSIQGLRIFFVTFPEGIDITALVPAFEISKKAKLFIGDQQITNGRTPVDFSKNGIWTVVAEDGEHSSDYMVIARHGDPAVDQLVYEFMGSYNIPAVGIAVNKGGKLAYSGGYGLAEVSASEPVFCTEGHLFRLASVSKSLTAICILKLCQEGKIGLEDKVFAEGGILAPLYPGTHKPMADDVRIIDLLTHRAGWNNYGIGTDPIFTGDNRFSGKSLQKRVAYMIQNCALSSAPGTQYSYFNMGYCILGQIIEQVTGKSYETYLRDVAAEAGADDIWQSKTAKSKRRQNECVFYSQDGAYPYDNNMDVASSCGAVIASAPDMARILLAVDGNGATADILSGSWLDKMCTNYTSTGKGGYGLGWWIGHNGWSAWKAWHTGSLSGSATLWVLGNNGTSGVILCNSRSSKDTFDNAMSAALDGVMSRILQTY